MTHFLSQIKWLPLVILVTMAIAYEPMRSGFNLANQSCEYFPTASQFTRTFFNVKHIIGYGIICLVALFTVRNIAMWHTVIGVLIFSTTMELLQSFFVTGHCRAWDLIPNTLGIGLALALFLITRVLPKN